MTAAIDTNILLDLLNEEAPDKEASLALLEREERRGRLVTSEAVYAELAGRFSNRRELDVFLTDTGVQLERSSEEALQLAGAAWRTYTRRRPRALVCARCGAAQSVRCETCGEPVRARQHIVADFLIGAHALVHADRLLTRDRGFYATYFPALALA